MVRPRLNIGGENMVSKGSNSSSHYVKFLGREGVSRRLLIKLVKQRPQGPLALIIRQRLSYQLGAYPVLKKWLGYRQADRRDGFRQNSRPAQGRHSRRPHRYVLRRAGSIVEIVE